VPWGLKRYQQSKQTHFVTFSCYRRLPLLTSSRAKHTFESGLERVRRQYGLRVYGYVVMPEHVHLLVGEPERADLAQAIKSLKQGVSRRLIGDAKKFWHMASPWMR
jgi:putative transposase